MARTEPVHDGGVVLGALIGVLDHKRDRRAGGDAIENPGENPDLIQLPPLRRVARLAGPAPLQIPLQIVLRQRHPGRTAIDDAADRGTVTFTKTGDRKERSDGISRHGGDCSRATGRIPSPRVNCRAWSGFVPDQGTTSTARAHTPRDGTKDDRALSQTRPSGCHRPAHCGGGGSTPPAPARSFPNRAPCAPCLRPHPCG